MEELYYYEIAIDSVANRNHIIQESKLLDYIKSSIKRKTELYHSVYKYNDELATYFEHHDSISRYKGKFYLDKLIFDIDRAKSTDEWVLDKTRKFVQHLIDVWQLHTEYIQIWYSGTGYHVVVWNYFGQFEDRQSIKNTITKYFGSWCDLSTYVANPLIRAPYSLNLKSGLYKIPLTYKELTELNAKEIMDLAKSNRPRIINVISKETKGDYDWSNKIDSAPMVRDDVEVKKNFTTNRTNIVMCAQTIYDNGEPPDNRHNHLMRLVSVLRSRGATEKMITDAVLSGWNKTLQTGEVKRVIQDIYARAYNYGCNDHVLSAYCDEQCMFYKRKNLTASVKGIEDIVEGLVAHIEKVNNGSFLDLRYIFNLPQDYRIYDGELVILYGDTKLGKSMVAQNIAIKYPNKKFLLMCLENGNNLDSRRLLQIGNEMSRAEVEKAVMSGEDIYDPIRHISFYEGHIHIDEMDKLIATSQVDVIIIDTVDQIATKASNDNYTAKIQEITVKLREYTIKYKKTIIGVHHINRNSAEDSDGKTKSLTVHSGKGSSALEQKADKVIGIEGDRDGTLRRIRSLAARDESPFDTYMVFDKETFTLRVNK